MVKIGWTETEELPDNIESEGTIMEAAHRMVQTEDGSVGYLDLTLAVHHDQARKILPDGQIKVGFPAKLSDNSLLGAALLRSGFPRDDFDSDSLVACAVRFDLVRKEKTINGETRKLFDVDRSTFKITARP